MSTNTKAILVLVLLCALLVGLYQTYQRIRIEEKENTVEIAVDYRDVLRLALEDKLSLQETLLKLKQAGVTSIGLPEETLETATEAGNLQWAPGFELINLEDEPGVLPLFRNLTAELALNYIYPLNQTAHQRVYDELTNLFSGAKVKLNGTFITVDHYAGELKEAGLGLNTKLITSLENLDFRVIPRLYNNKFFTEKSIVKKLFLMRSYGQFDYVICEKDEVLGYPNLLKNSAQAIKDFQLKLGNIEFSKQEGSSTLAKYCGDQSIKVHSIPEDEILTRKIDKNEALERFSRAIRERGVRLIYVHPFFNLEPAKNYLSYNTKFIAELKTRITTMGYNIGVASNIKPFSLALWQLLILGLGAFALSIALLWYFTDLVDWLVYTLAASFILCLLVAIQLFGVLFAQKMLAALVAIVAPTYAVISNFEREPKGYTMPRALQIVLHCVTDTALGIILIIGLLADSRFMSGAELFFGIKLVLILPALIVPAYFFYKDEYGRSLLEKFKTFMQVRISMAYLCGALVFLAMAAVVMVRSDNFMVPVLGMEKQFRIMLEQFLFARPRLKEFLIGYPFLFLAASYCLNHHKRWLWLLLAIGTLGLTSLTNTFCHIHSPVVLSTLRSVNGLVLGLIIGCLVNALALHINSKKNA